jgi:hypothetical protein
MPKDSIEWLRQADYDIETAEAMLKAGRYLYKVLLWIKQEFKRL